MAKQFPMEPQPVEAVSTKYRHVKGSIPNEQTLEALKALRSSEPLSMQGQPPVIWDRAEGFQIYDQFGNKWLDFSSGVLVTNAGHGHPRILQAILDEVKKPLLTTYCFPNMPRVKLTQQLVKEAPEGLDKVFLLSTGSEACECALKLMRTYGRNIDHDKKVIVSFEKGFHGRTMGSQMMGGIPGGKEWIGNLDKDMVQVPFPDGLWNEDLSFELFEKTLADKGVDPSRVCGVIVETYQGAGPNFLPKEYAQKLRKWCDANKALLCFDEVQAGFGRCGTMWGFQLYEVIPDLFCMGKGMSSSLPISGVIGRSEVMDQYGPNQMTSTHTGNPVCSAAALASLEVIRDEKLVQNSAKLGKVLAKEMDAIKADFPNYIGAAYTRGLVSGLQIINNGKVEPNSDMAWDIINLCFRKGLMMFAPVGHKGCCVKIAPPLNITEEALLEGCAVVRESVETVCR